MIRSLRNRIRWALTFHREMRGSVSWWRAWIFSIHHTEDDSPAEVDDDIVMWSGRPMVRTITTEKFELPDGTFYEMQNEIWNEMQDGGNETWNARG